MPKPVSSLRMATETVVASRASAASRTVVEPPGRTTIGRRNSTSSSSGGAVWPDSAVATWVIASMPITAGNSRSPSSRWSARYGSLPELSSASVTSSTPG